MKTNCQNSKNNTDKPSQDIRSKALFTDMKAEEEVFVRGGTSVFPSIVGRPKMPGIM
ncbi:MAG: hypothetical protein WBV73_17675 [Phormidium sp.]